MHPAVCVSGVDLRNVLDGENDTQVRVSLVCIIQAQTLQIVGSSHTPGKGSRCPCFPRHEEETRQAQRVTAFVSAMALFFLPLREIL